MGGNSRMQIHAPSVMSKSIFSGPKLWAVLVVAMVLPVASGSGFQRAQPTNSVVGTINSPIRLEVFSDFECPACRAFYMDAVTRTMEEYGRSGKICILYYEFPLNMHAYSRRAARYSLAAQRIGRKQWLAVMNALYATQPLWSQDGEIEKALAGAVSSDTLRRIKEIAQEPSIENELGREVALGEKMGVKSTPTIFVTAKNKTEKVERVLPYDVWKGFFNDILK
jgi:protein-disulfide isomerase